MSRSFIGSARDQFLTLIGSLLGRRRDITAAHGRARELGSYRLLARIGEGGMGEVWRASHRMLARKAAVKVIRPRMPAHSSQHMRRWVNRFRREANVIAGLQSPHTIQLYDFGVSRDGQFYYAMELLDGITLRELVIRFGPQSAPRVRAILLQICESLEEAHEQGFVHRDLKPANVMLSKVALIHDFVKVLDFGLAKCAACGDAMDLSIDGMMGGTPGYIAPEVALGRRDVDGRADIYALGCVAYFLLTGTAVFRAANATAMALKHVQVQPAPPSARTELPIPVDLERVIMRCLAKDPADRPATVREVAELLTACDFPVWSAEQAAAWWQRHLPPTSSRRSSSGTSEDESARRARAS